MVTLAFLGTLVFVLKLAMAGLPNIEPVSLLLILYAIVLGRWAICPTLLYVFMEILVFGLGPWSFAYLYAWPLLTLLSCLFRKMESPLGWAVLSGAFGLCFGALNAIPYVLISGWAGGIAWWLSGIPFDVLHCAGNFVLALVLLTPLRRVLSRLCVGVFPTSQ